MTVLKKWIVLQLVGEEIFPETEEENILSTIKHVVCDVTNQYYVTKEGMSIKGR